MSLCVSSVEFRREAVGTRGESAGADSVNWVEIEDIESSRFPSEKERWDIKQRGISAHIFGFCKLTGTRFMRAHDSIPIWGVNGPST